MPRLSGCRSGWPPSSLPSAPRGAQSDPLPTDSPGAAPLSRRREPASADRHRGRRGRSPSRASRPARALRTLSVFLVAVTALLALPLQAQAQTTLVSNTGQSDNGTARLLTSTNAKRAQAFTTGANADGYTLNSIGFDFDDIDDIMTAGSHLTVTLNADSSGDPGNDLCTLTDPTTFSGSGVQTFDAPTTDPCPTLAASTTYFAVIERVTSTSDHLSLEVTTAGAEDDGGAMGWSIGNARHYVQGGMWRNTASQSHLIEVRGSAVGTVSTSPSVASIAFNSAGADGAFKTDDAVTATVTFSESVTVDTTDGTPQLTIKMGGTDKVLDYSSGSPGTALVFSGYTVAANDEDTDGLSVEANKLDANGGTIKKTADASVDAVLTHAAVAASAQHKVDGVKPTLVTSGDDAPKTSLDGSKIILVFNENIGSVDTTKITVKVGTTTQTITGGSRSGTEVELTLMTALAATATNITVELSADAVADVPGNGIAAVSATTVTRTLPPGKPTLTLAAKDQSIDATVVFTAHGTSDITKYQYQIKTTGSYGSWTDSTDNVSNTGGTFTIGSLTNGTEYTVKVRGVNSDGEGAESDAKAATPDAPPAVDSVAITSDPGTDKTYAIDEDIVVTVTFDKNITLSGTGIEPYISLFYGPGANDSWEPDCTVGTPPTKDLVCTYTVVGGDEASNGVEVGSVSHEGKRIVGPLEQEANTTYSVLAADSDHKVDGIRPTLSRADADPNDLTKIVLTFSEAIGTVDNTKITVKKGGTDQTTTGAAIDSTDSTKVEITLMTALLSTDTNITVDLAADAVKDVPGNGIAEVLGTSVSVEDNTAPTFVSAGTNGTDEVVLTYDEALNTTQPATSAFTVKVGGTGRGVDTVAISGSAVTLTLASAFRPGDTLTVSYTKPGSNPIKDAADNEAASLAETTVTNNLAATAPDAPGSLVATATHADKVTLTWDTPWNNGSAITRFEYRGAVGNSVPASVVWTAVPDSGPTTRGFSVVSLAPGTEHAFEIRAVNGEGNGDEAAATATTLTPSWRFTLRDASNNNVHGADGGRRFGDGDGVDHQQRAVQRRADGDHPMVECGSGGLPRPRSGRRHDVDHPGGREHRQPGNPHPAGSRPADDHARPQSVRASANESADGGAWRIADRSEHRSHRRRRRAGTAREHHGSAERDDGGRRRQLRHQGRARPVLDHSVGRNDGDHRPRRRAERNGRIESAGLCVSGHRGNGHLHRRREHHPERRRARRDVHAAAETGRSRSLHARHAQDGHDHGARRRHAAAGAGEFAGAGGQHRGDAQLAGAGGVHAGPRPAGAALRVPGEGGDGFVQQLGGDPGRRRGHQEPQVHRADERGAPHLRGGCGERRRQGGRGAEDGDADRGRGGVVRRGVAVDRRGRERRGDADAGHGAGGRGDGDGAAHGDAGHGAEQQRVFGACRRA